MTCEGVLFTWSSPSEACLVNGLVGVKRGLWSLEEELTEVFLKDGDRSVGRYFDGHAGSPLLYATLIVVSRQFGGGCSSGFGDFVVRS